MSASLSSVNSNLLNDCFYAISVNPVPIISSTALLTVSAKSALVALSAVSITSKVALGALSLVSGIYGLAFLGAHLFGMGVLRLAKAKQSTVSTASLAPQMGEQNRANAAIRTEQAAKNQFVKSEQIDFE